MMTMPGVAKEARHGGVPHDGRPDKGSNNDRQKDKRRNQATRTVAGYSTGLGSSHHRSIHFRFSPTSPHRVAEIFGGTLSVASACDSIELAITNNEPLTRSAAVAVDPARACFLVVFLPRSGVSRCKLAWQKFDDHCHRCQHLSREVGSMNEQPNTTDQSQNQEESAYSLLIRSEEKSRNAFELTIYPCLILGPLIAILQFTQHSVNIPAAGLKGPHDIVFDASVQNDISRDGFYPLHRLGHPEIKG
jgi:hypothetical protein